MEMLEKIFAFGESAKLVLRGPRSRDPIGPTAQEISRGESWSSAKWFESSRERERERERIHDAGSKRGDHDEDELRRGEGNREGPRYREEGLRRNQENRHLSQVRRRGKVF